MKNILTKKLATGFIFIAAAAGMAAAQNDAKSGGGRLTGTWEVQVTVRNCQTQDPIASFAALANFSSDGTLIVTESGTPPARKAPAHGVWAHATRSTYRFRTRSFTFDANGTFTGWIIINNEVTLDRSADEFTAIGTAGVFTPNGIKLFSGCSTLAATRFTLD